MNEAAKSIRPMQELIAVSAHFLGKPRIRISASIWLEQNGKAWECQYRGLKCAGATPEEAYEALIRRLERMRRIAAEVPTWFPYFIEGDEWI